jgi:hypothetical protein
MVDMWLFYIVHAQQRGKRNATTIYISIIIYMYLYQGGINAELLHVRSMDNRAIDVVANLEEAVTGLAMGAGVSTNVFSQ